MNSPLREIRVFRFPTMAEAYPEATEEEIQKDADLGIFRDSEATWMPRIELEVGRFHGWFHGKSEVSALVELGNGDVRHFASYLVQFVDPAPRSEVNLEKLDIPDVLT